MNIPQDDCKCPVSTKVRHRQGLQVTAYVEVTGTRVEPFSRFRPRSPAGLSRGLGVPVVQHNEGEKMIENDIGPVEQVFVMMVRVLDEADQDLILGEMHSKSNRLSASHLRMLDEIDIFKIDPCRYGYIALVEKLEKELQEACQ